MTTILNGFDALAILLGSSVGMSPEEALAAAKEVHDEHDAKLKDITPEIEDKLQGWLTTAATTTNLDAFGVIIKEVGAFHDQDDTHSYRGLCQRIGMLGETFSYIGAFRFGDKYNQMLDGLWAK